MKLNKRIAHALGYDIIRLNRGDFSLETNLIKAINKFDIDLVLDVGANYGQFAERLRSSGYAGEVHSFEPIGFIFKELQAKSAADAKWFTHNLAMGSTQGSQTINIMAGNDFSSFLNPSDFGKAQYESSTRVQDRETVEVDTISNFLATNVPNYRERRIFLKMDTQGYDLEVFRGASDVLQSVKGMLSELSFIPIYDGMTNYLDTLKEFQASGFHPSGFYPINRDSDGLVLIEMDCMLVRSGDLP
ncbi:MAG: FkbM family methyltransferase [Rhodospirillaceae bacterium]|nr:FkbM family methyltransferase [Rhodospirillaceae bacterium]